MDEKKPQNIKFFVILAIVILAIAGLLVLAYFVSNRCFYDYEVKSFHARNDSNNVTYEYYEKNILKYSRSGISAIDNEGNTLWNGGFEMKQPQVDTTGKYVVACDVGGKKVYVYSGEDEGKELETALPIVRAKISKTGIVAVLVEDTDSNVINIYNPYSSSEKLLVEIPTNVSEEGYPLDFDISQDGKSVVTSHMVVKDGKIETRVGFYNFTEVGQDKNTMVGGKNFTGEVVSRIEFINNDTVAIFRQNGLSLFTNMKQPQEKKEIKLSNIRSLAYNEKNIAVITENGDSKTLYIYDENGNEKKKRDLEFKYSQVSILGDEIIFLTSHECKIIRTNGHDKFKGEFKEEIQNVFPTENPNIYTIIDANQIKKVEVK